MEVDRTKRFRSSETSEPQPPTPSRAERHALLEQDALEKERIARQARLKADMMGAVLRRRAEQALDCLLYTSPSPRDRQKSRMPSSA